MLTLWGQFSLVVAVLPVAENALSIAGQVVLSGLLLGGAYVASEIAEDVLETVDTIANNPKPYAVPPASATPRSC